MERNNLGNNGYLRKISFLLYGYFFSSALSPLISFLLNIDYSHIIIIVLMFILILIYLMQNGRIIINKLVFPIYLYVFIVILGILSGLYYDSINSSFIVRSLTFRILFPVLFLLFFSSLNNLNQINLVGYNVVKVVNFICIILGIFGLIEKINPFIVYNFYGDNLTSHLFLSLGGERSIRLISLAGNPINLGFYMTIGIGSAIALILRNYRRRKIFVFFELLCIGVFMYIMFSTYSRAAMLTTFVMVLAFTFMLLRNVSISRKMVIIFFSVTTFILLGAIILNISSISTRISSISLEAYFNNIRFKRSYSAFNEGTSFNQILFGHSIRQMNTSASYVFELGYASLLYESGLLGFIVVIGSYFKGLVSGIKINRKKYNETNIYIDSFYIATIVSGFAGMLVEDLYMQQPYSLFLWFSTFYLVTKHSYSRCFIKSRKN